MFQPSIDAGEQSGVQTRLAAVNTFIVRADEKLTLCRTRPMLLFIPLMLGCFALLPRAQAVGPAPDGGYPRFNTAEGTKPTPQTVLNQ